MITEAQVLLVTLLVMSMILCRAAWRFFVDSLHREYPEWDTWRRRGRPSVTGGEGTTLGELLKRLYAKDEINRLQRLSGGPFYLGD